MKTTTAFVISHESDPARTAKDNSTSIIALTLTRALGRAGIRVIRVHPNLHDNSLSSRYSNATEICPDHYESESELNQFLIGLDQKYPGKKVLLPASDDCSLYLTRNAAQLRKAFILINPSAETMESVKDKRRQYNLATEIGLPIPETDFPDNETELLGVAEKLTDFPCVIKPVEAQKWRLRQYAHVAGGGKAITVHNPGELIAEYRRISSHDSDIMVQEIIGGEDQCLLTFLAYCSPEHKPLAHCVRSKLRQFPVDFGYCTATVSCHNDTVVDYSRRLLEKSNYVGLVGIEFKYDSEIDDYKLIEINTRPVNTMGISLGCGVNLPLIAFRDAIGESQTPISDWEDGVVWLRLAQDYMAARELRRLGRTDFLRWLGTLRGKRVHAILAADDMKPFIQFYTRFLIRQFSKLGSILGIRKISQQTKRWLERVGASVF